MIEVTISSSPHFINYSGLKVQKDRAWDKLASTSFRKEGAKSVIFGLLGRHLSIGGDAMLETEELPASISYLDTSLTNVQVDYFSHLLLMFMPSELLQRIYKEIGPNMIRINSLTSEIVY